AIGRYRTLPDGRSSHHFAEIADEDRHTFLACLNDDVGDVVGFLGETDASQQILLGAMFDISAADIRVVAPNRFEDISKRQTERLQLGGIEAHLVLLFQSAKTVNFDHAGNTQQLSPHAPILNRTQGRRVITASSSANELVLVDLAEA